MKKSLDLSNNSTNPYTIELRHGMIPTCMVCKTFTPVVLDGSDYYKYFVQGSGDVQTIFPYLSPGEREILLTGIHPDCWNTLFEEDDES